MRERLGENPGIFMPTLGKMSNFDSIFVRWIEDDRSRMRTAHLIENHLTWESNSPLPQCQPL